MERASRSTLACPQCTAVLERSADERLDCRGCTLTYPVRHGVPVLLISEATCRPIETDAQFDYLLDEALAAPFHGWDLSWLHARTTRSPELTNLEQRYDSRAAALIAQAEAVLDLGTGGGERFASYAPFPGAAFATEAYLPNVTAARLKLAPLGVEVVHTDPNCHNGRGPQPGNRWPERRLPFGNNTFELVLAHRAAFSPAEAARVLRPGGSLLTLQGVPEWRGETLAAALGGTPPEWTLPGLGWDVGETFRQSGLQIVDWSETSSTVLYHDIGAIVYLLLHVRWNVLDFDVDHYRERLYRLHQRMQSEGGFRLRGASRLIEAYRP